MRVILPPSPVPGTKPALYNLAAADGYFWYQGDDKHLLVIEKNVISLMDSDGSNKIGIFSGDFDPSAVFDWPDGSKLVISININSKANPLPNFYTLDLR